MKEWMFILIPIALIQFFVPVVEIQLVLHIGLGCFYAFFSEIKGAFLKALLSEMIVILVVYFLNFDYHAYIGKMLIDNGMPALLSPVLLVVINAMTVGLCFQVGYSLRALTSGDKKRI